MGKFKVEFKYNGNLYSQQSISEECTYSPEIKYEDMVVQNILYRLVNDKVDLVKRIV